MEKERRIKRKESVKALRRSGNAGRTAGLKEEQAKERFTEVRKDLGAKESKTCAVLRMW